MTHAEIQALTVEQLPTLSDGDLDHLIDCQHQIGGIGNAWGRSLQAEAKRRRQARLDDTLAAASVAALGDRGAGYEPAPDLFAIVLRAVL
jgi:hypothetical protein